ncbi:MAG: hypothetical protein ACLQPH_20915, partial [Acidimicrobiales bacterium]
WISLDLNDRYVRLDQHPAIRRQIDQGEIPRPGADPLERLVWLIGVLTLALEAAVDRHPEWSVRTHESLCVEPADQFRRLFAELGLAWNDDAERYLVANNRPGEGFPTQRVASDQADGWKTRLTAEQVGTMRRVLAELPLRTWGPEDFVP